jgi:hypothetical protein
MKTVILRSILFITLIAYTTGANAQSTFPDFEVETVSGEMIQIPKALEGKRSILFLAFSQRAEEILSDWYEPVYTLFLDKSGINAMAYDCNVKLIMMFTGTGQAIAGQVIENVRNQTDEEYEDYLLFFSGDFKDKMERLGITQKQDAYVFVLDEKSTVVFQSQGKYSEEKLDKIAELVEL